MQRGENVALRIVVIDYQRCAFAPENLNDEHFLSPTLIAFLAAHHYDLFVGHTFRCLINIDDFRNNMLNAVPVSEQGKFRKNFSTKTITDHLAERTTIECLTVSTLDDLVTEDVGAGYNALVNYENNGVITDNKHVEQGQQFEWMKQNNRQLLLIAQHIAKNYPGKTIQLDIIDDDLQHCSDALHADQQAGWPECVKLNKIYRYSTRIMNDKVTEMTASTMAASHKRVNVSNVPAPKRRFDTTSADTHAASILVSGTYGTFKPAAAANSPEPRRSARLAGKGRAHY